MSRSGVGAARTNTRIVIIDPPTRATIARRRGEEHPSEDSIRMQIAIQDRLNPD
jgi:hypothetical protein